MTQAALAALLEGVWAIDESYLSRLYAAAERDAPLARTSPMTTAATAPARPGNATALIPVHGPISRRPDLFALLFGVEDSSLSAIGQSLDQALADPGVGHIVMHIDSPGGEAAGITELAQRIYDARAKKPITAFVDTTAASAAYWLASQADRILITPSGEVGSIGIVAMHMDRSEEMKMLGRKPTFITAGKYKAEENSFTPLSDEAKAAVQERVDAFYSMFVRDVARGRDVSVETVRKSFGQGRMVLAKDAVTVGMADAVSDRITAPKMRAASDHALTFAAAHAAIELTKNF